MKKLLLSLLLATVCFATYAQNTFPTPSGNVGIGTSTPVELLDLGSSVSVKQLIYGSGTGGNVGYYMGFGVDLGQALNSLTAFIGPPAGDGVNGPASFSVASATTTWPYSAFTTRFTVLSTGNVLIGEASQKNSAYILDVNGSVRANAVTVNATGADFVFAPSYKLLTLPELNNFIQKNHHLPEIASAKDMQANGLNLGDNQIKLLQKVEELTLYLIDKDKQLNEQNATINKQQSQIDLQNTKLSQSDMNSKIQSEQLKSLQGQMDQLKAQLSRLLKQQKN